MKLTVVLFAVLLAAANGAEVDVAAKQPKDAKRGAASVAVIAPAGTKVAVTKDANGGSQTNVVAPGTVASSTTTAAGDSRTTVSAPGTTVTSTTTPAGGTSTSVRTVGTDVDVQETPAGTVTRVNTPVVGVENTPEGTMVAGIPFVGSVFVPGGRHRKVLRAF